MTTIPDVLDDEARNGLQRDLCAAVAEAGYDAPIHVTPRTTGSTISTTPHPGCYPWTIELRHHDSMSNAVAAALRLADLSQIARDRNDAIRNAGGSVDKPPAWVFVAHPIATAMLVAGGIDLANGPLPLQPPAGSVMAWTTTVTSMRIGYTGLRIEGPHGTTTTDANNEMARIVVAGSFPETYVQGIVGMRVGDVLGLSALTPGMGGDDPVRDAHADADGLWFTVRSRLRPMAEAPVGIERPWLSAWLERHA